MSGQLNDHLKQQSSYTYPHSLSPLTHPHSLSPSKQAPREEVLSEIRWEEEAICHFKRGDNRSTPITPGSILKSRILPQTGRHIDWASQWAFFHPTPLRLYLCPSTLPFEFQFHAFNQHNYCWTFPSKYTHRTCPWLLSGCYHKIIYLKAYIWIYE